MKKVSLALALTAVATSVTFAQTPETSHGSARILVRPGMNRPMASTTSHGEGKFGRPSMFASTTASTTPRGDKGLPQEFILKRDALQKDFDAKMKALKTDFENQLKALRATYNLPVGRGDEGMKNDEMRGGVNGSSTSPFHKDTRDGQEFASGTPVRPPRMDGEDRPRPPMIDRNQQENQGASTSRPAIFKFFQSLLPFGSANAAQ